MGNKRKRKNSKKTNKSKNKNKKKHIISQIKNLEKDITNVNNLNEFNNSFIEGNRYKTSIPSKNIINKKINPDGNCFYNAISYYYHLTEEYHENYREMIYSACANSIDELKEFMFSDSDNDLNEEDRISKTKEYINNIRINGNWAGDFEINKMAIILQINILCYTENENQYNMQGVFYGTDNLIKLIPMKFVNNNHFELLYPLNYFIPFNIIPLDEKTLKDKIDKNNKQIKKEKNPNLFKNVYVDFNHSNKNKYNEIYKFLTSGKFPERIENILCKKKNIKNATSLGKMLIKII